MNEVQPGTRTMVTLRMALDRVPIHFLGIHEKARIEHAYETPIEGVYNLYISYGPYALRGVMFLWEPDMHLYLDYASMLTVIQSHITYALQEYNSTSDPRYRGM